MIGIIGAMKAEVDALKSALQNPAVKRACGIEFVSGELYSHRVVVAESGIGKVFAALCAQAMICLYSPDIIINTGVAGALEKSLAPCDVVIATSFVQHDMDTSALGDEVGLVSGINKVYFDTDKVLSETLFECAKASGASPIFGRVATGDRFVCGKEEKKKIAERFSAAACEMEGGAIAQVAFVNNVRFAAVRAISDSLDGSAQMEYSEFLPRAAATSYKTTDRFLSLFKE